MCSSESLLRDWSFFSEKQRHQNTECVCGEEVGSAGYNVTEGKLLSVLPVPARSKYTELDTSK